MAGRGQGEEYITGKVKFSQTVTPSQFDKYSVVLYPDEESLKIIDDLKKRGIKNELKKDDDGYFIAFHRPTFIQKQNGARIGLEAPKIMNKEGNFVTDVIGPGSDVTVTLEIYGGKGPKGSYMAARLAAVRINNLVPYGSNAMTPNEKKQVRDLANQPQQVWD